MKKILILATIFTIGSINAGQSKPKTIPGAPKISAEVEQAVKDYVEALDGLGDLLIKNGF